MSVILYVETNFLMSVAMGRKPNGDDILSAITDDFRVFMPSDCYMEAFSALNTEKNLLNRFTNDLDHHISHLSQDFVSRRVSSLRSMLEQSRVENSKLYNDIEMSLFDFIEKTAIRIELIQLTPLIVQESVKVRLIPKPKDNLALHSILADARSRPQETKALLTENSKVFSEKRVLSALKEAGVSKYFPKSSDALDWIGSWKS